MANTEKPLDPADDDLWSIYEKDIEEIVVDSNSDEDYEDEPIHQKKVIAKERESESRKKISSLYSNIQELLGGGENEEPRLRILKKATSACKQLCQEELHLKYETEVLLQRNWKLKQCVEKLQKKKKRKSGSATITRRLSGPPTTSPSKTPIEKRSASVDESKLIIKTENEIKTNETETVETPKAVVCAIQRTQKKKIKRSTGLSDEEKEFYKIEEKIEDLLFEVEALWNDVNNDEERESDSDDKRVTEDVKPINFISERAVSPPGVSKIKVTDINKLIEPELKPVTNKEAAKGIRVNDGDTQPLNRDVIKIANISKLLDPKQNPIISSNDSPGFSSILIENRRSSTSGDESPRLVIDESPGRNIRDENFKLNQRELDVMEALQAVDTLCLSLVSDEPTTSESQPVVVEINKSKNPGKLDVIAISDSEDDGDVVCIE